MPPRRHYSSEDHLRQAGIHEASAEAITHPEAKVVCAFYAAVHLINAYLAKNIIYPKNHDERKEEVEERPELGRIVNAYNLLFDAAWQARYECLPSYEVQKDADKCLDWLAKIRKHVEGLMAR